MILSRHLLAASITAASLQSTAVLANDDDMLLEEIIVTASKRKQTLLEVPMSISALGEASLERITADRYEDYVSQIPGLTLNANGSNRAKFSIRGITTSSSQSNTQVPVAVYHDDLPVLDSFASFVTPDLRLFDVNRVEVLRGPQGTLFGSGALGGAIRVITNKPEMSEFQGKLAATIVTNKGGDTSQALSSMFNFPIVEDELALRAVVYYRDDGGYVDNIARRDSNVDGHTSVGGRAMLNWQPNNSLSFLLTVSSQDDDSNDQAYTFLTGPKNQYDSFAEEETAVEFTTTNLVTEYQFGSTALTSSTTYSTRNERLANDLTAGIQPIVSPFGITAGILNQLEGQSDVFAEEVRLASASDNALQWLVGAFYIEAERYAVSSMVADGADSLFNLIGFPTAGMPYLPDSIFGSVTKIKTTEKAVFGELTYAFTDQISATAGARWFSNRQDLFASTAGLLAAGSPLTDRSTEESAITPKLSISYWANSDTHVYIQAAKGCRVGQNNLTLPLLPGFSPPPENYDSDSLWNYEIGVKATLLEGRLKINTAAFYIDWTDVQLQQQVGPLTFIDNAGKASSQGLELELEYLLTKSLRFGTAITYTDTELKTVEAGVAAQKGDELPGTSKFKITNHLQWSHALNSGVMTHLRLDQHFSSAAYTHLNNGTSDETDAYNILNVSYGADFGEWQVNLFVKNLTNTDRRMNIFTDAGRRAAIRVKPRKIGVNLRYSF